MKRAAHDVLPARSDTASINAGGRLFVASKSTLEKSGYLSSILAGRWSTDTTEPIFLDCDPDTFHYLLQYMRTDQPAAALPRGDEQLFASILSAAEFYILPSSKSGPSSRRIGARTSRSQRSSAER